MIQVYDFRNRYFWGNCEISNGRVTAVYLARHDGDVKTSIELAWDAEEGFSADGGYDVDGVASYIAKHGKMRHGFPIPDPRHEYRMYTRYELPCYEYNASDIVKAFTTELETVSILSVKVDNDGYGVAQFMLLPR